MFYCVVYDEKKSTIQVTWNKPLYYVIIKQMEKMALYRSPEYQTSETLLWLLFYLRALICTNQLDTFKVWNIWRSCSGEMGGKRFQDGNRGGHLGFSFGTILAVLINKSPPYYLSSFRSISFSVKKKYFKLDFQDGCYGCHLWFPIEPTSAKKICSGSNNDDYLNSMSPPPNPDASAQLEK